MKRSYTLKVGEIFCRNNGVIKIVKITGDKYDFATYHDILFDDETEAEYEDKTDYTLTKEEVRHAIHDHCGKYYDFINYEGQYEDDEDDE